MSVLAKEQSNILDELFVEYGGLVRPTPRGGEPRCGYPAIMRYVREHSIPLPLTPEQEAEIDAIIMA
jgi:hypothetical protein